MLTENGVGNPFPKLGIGNFGGVAVGLVIELQIAHAEVVQEPSGKIFGAAERTVLGVDLHSSGIDGVTFVVSGD